MLGRTVGVFKMRGRTQRLADGTAAVATSHPSILPRIKKMRRQRKRERPKFGERPARLEEAVDRGAISLSLVHDCVGGCNI